MTSELYSDGKHRCVAYADAGGGPNVGVQSNQFLIIDHGHAALIDPGGDISYPPLYMSITSEIMVKDLDLLLLSHQDPDVAGALSKWLNSTDCTVYAPKVWLRFLPHFCRTANAIKLISRIQSIPDEGLAIPLGQSYLLALPAHFLHSDGNFQFYDPVSKILFSGDMGASMEDSIALPSEVEDFDAHIPLMIGFLRRHMGSNKICRLWVKMIRRLDVEMIVPQHGAAFMGSEMVNRFLDWVEVQECGVDLMSEVNYVIPRRQSQADRG